MKNYEIMLIAKPDEKTAEAVLSKVQKIIADDIVRTEKWGKKRLAYEIQNLQEGYYYLIEFVANPETVRELNRVLLITEDCLRHLIIRKGE
jgi:small subunit ribosomal protein S6